MRRVLFLVPLFAAISAHVRADDELPSGAVKRLVVTEDGEGVLWSVVFSPDGKTLACGGSLKKVHLWDVKSGEHLRSFGTHPDTVWTAAFTPDGKILCSGGRADLTLRVWNPATGEELTPFVGHRGGITRIRFFPDGKRLVMSGGSWDPTIRVWDVAKREQLLALTGHTDLIDAVDVASHGRLAISGSRDGTLRVWSLTNRRELQRHDHPADDPGYAAVAFSPDGRLYASGTLDGQFQVRETLTHRRALPLRDRERSVRAIAFSPDGKLVAFAGDTRTVEVLDVRTGESLQSLKGHRNTIHAVAFSPDGKLLASAGSDATALIWQAAKAPDLHKRPSDEERLQAWERLASDNPVMARHGITTLGNDTGPVVEFLAMRLKPVPLLDERPLEERIAQLAAPRFADRERASRELEQAGERAEPMLQRAMARTESLEARRRLERLLERIERADPDAEQRQALRAIAVLEQQGTDAARRLLERLAAGAPGARLTVEAAESRARMR